VSVGGVGKRRKIWGGEGGGGEGGCMSP